MADYVQQGASIDYTPSVAVTAGDVIVQNTLVGVAKLDIDANALGALAVEGVFDFAKDTGSATAIAAGKKVYWDEDNEVATETAEGNPYVGKTVKAAANADATARVRLEQ